MTTRRCAAAGPLPKENGGSPEKKELDPELKAKIKEYLLWDRNQTTRAEIQGYADKKDYETLSKLLLKRINFGTAGLRGNMSGGYACMNDLVIIQTSQGLLQYLLGVDECLLKKSGVVFGYDGRHNSKRCVIS